MPTRSALRRTAEPEIGRESNSSPSLNSPFPVVIAIATLEALFLAIVMRRNYNWRAYFASLADALGREYIVMIFLTVEHRDAR